MLEIKSNDHKKTRKILLDGREFDVVVPGAGTELTMAQLGRRIKLLTKKEENGEATEQDLDRLDDMETRYLELSMGILKDGTPDNKHVKAWFYETPTDVVQRAFEDMMEQFQASEKKEEGDAGSDTKEA